MNPQANNMVAQALFDQQRQNQDWYNNALMNQVNNKRMVSSGGMPSGQPGYRPAQPMGPTSGLPSGLYGLGAQ